MLIKHGQGGGELHRHIGGWWGVNRSECMTRAERADQGCQGTRCTIDSDGHALGLIGRRCWAVAMEALSKQRVRRNGPTTASIPLMSGLESLRPSQHHLIVRSGSPRSDFDLFVLAPYPSTTSTGAAAASRLFLSNSWHRIAILSCTKLRVCTWFNTFMPLLLCPLCPRQPVSPPPARSRLAGVETREWAH